MSTPYTQQISHRPRARRGISHLAAVAVSAVLATAALASPANATEPGLYFDDAIRCHRVVGDRDAYFFGGVFYRFRDGGWLRASSFRGPWIAIGVSTLPVSFVRYVERPYYRGRALRPIVIEKRRIVRRAPVIVKKRIVVERRAPVVVKKRIVVDRRAPVVVKKRVVVRDRDRGRAFQRFERRGVESRRAFDDRRSSARERGSRQDRSDARRSDSDRRGRETRAASHRGGRHSHRGRR